MRLEKLQAERTGREDETGERFISDLICKLDLEFSWVDRNWLLASDKQLGPIATRNIED
jgi:hypothetical protein